MTASTDPPDRGLAMMPLLRDVQRSLRASPVFALYVLFSLALAVYIGVLTFLMNTYPDVLPAGLAQMSHFGQESHRIHDVAYGAIFTAAVVGVLVQLRRPARNVAGMVMALLPWGGLLLAAVLSDKYAVIVERNPWYLLAVVMLITVLVHPAGRDFFRSFDVSRVSWLMVGLVGLAAVPLLSFASTNIRLQETVGDMHATMGHYGFMAAFSYTVIGVGLLASLRLDGWRVTAWVAGLLPALLGGLSWLYPDISSSFDLLWALAAVAWGVAFIAVAERSRHDEPKAPAGEWDESPPSGPSQQRTTAGTGS